MDLLQTSLPHLMDSGIKVEFNRNGGFYTELKRRWVRGRGW